MTAGLPAEARTGGGVLGGPVRLTLAYLTAAIAFTASRGDRRVVAYLLVIAVAGAAIAAVHRVAPLTRVTAYALSTCALLHLVGGLAPSPDPAAPVFYETWLVPHVLKYDQLVHFTISAVATVVGHRLVAALVRTDTGATARAVLAASLALAAGAINEAFEFVSALRFADAYVGGLTNAGWDLVFNAFGVASALVVLSASTRATAQGPPTNRRSLAAPHATRSPEACASHVANMSA